MGRERPARVPVLRKVPNTITHDQQLAKSSAELKHSSPISHRWARASAACSCSCRRALHSTPGLPAHFLPRCENNSMAASHSSLGMKLVRDPADRLLNKFKIARVAADPPRAEGDGQPGGWPGLAYFRLHGSPRIYYSSYENEYLDALAGRLRTLQRARIPTWCIFDNTTLGAATGNALSLIERLE